jgi:hypothetical protein
MPANKEEALAAESSEVVPDSVCTRMGMTMEMLTTL